MIKMPDGFGYLAFCDSRSIFNEIMVFGLRFKNLISIAGNIKVVFEIKSHVKNYTAVVASDSKLVRFYVAWCPASWADKQF